MEDSIGSIGWAVTEMRHGQRVCRRGWNGKGMWIAHHEGDEKIAEHVYMKPASGRLVVPWLCSATDLLATDWEIAE